MTPRQFVTVVAELTPVFLRWALAPVGLILTGVVVGIQAATLIPPQYSLAALVAISTTGIVLLIVANILRADARHARRRAEVDEIERRLRAMDDQFDGLPAEIIDAAKEMIAGIAMVQMQVHPATNEFSVTVQIGQGVPRRLVIDQLRRVATDIEHGTLPEN